jgi:hypothetical protein
MWNIILNFVLVLQSQGYVLREVKSSNTTLIIWGDITMSSIIFSDKNFVNIVGSFESLGYTMSFLLDLFFSASVTEAKKQFHLYDCHIFLTSSPKIWVIYFPQIIVDQRYIVTDHCSTNQWKLVRFELPWL